MQVTRDRAVRRCHHPCGGAAAGRRPWRLAWALAVLVPSGALANVITDWNAILLDAVRADLTAPPMASRNMAIVHTAMFDAVNAVEPSHHPYHCSEPAVAGASGKASAVAAAHR